MYSIIHPSKNLSQVYTLKDFSQNFKQTSLPAKECKINCKAMNHTGSYTLRVILLHNHSLTHYPSFSLAAPPCTVQCTFQVSSVFESEMTCVSRKIRGLNHLRLVILLQVHTYTCMCSFLHEFISEGAPCRGKIGL